MKKFITNVLLILGGIFVALILLEILTRFLLSPPYDYTEGAYACSNELGWRGNPDYAETQNTDGYEHWVQFNSSGMHDTEHQITKSDETFRILAIGDSFLAAVQVEEKETSHQQLENLLNDRVETTNFEVINGAVTGWGTGQELLYYRTEGKLYQPDLVFLFVYIGNDVIGNFPGEGRTLDGRNCYSPYFVVCGDQFDATPWLYAPGIESAVGECQFSKKLLTTVLGKLYQNSQLYAYFERLVPGRRPSIEIPYYPLYIPEENFMFDYSWDVTVATINQLYQETQNDGAKLIVVLISPADVITFSQMSADELEVVHQTIPDLQKAQLDLPHTKLTASLSEKGIDVLDLQPMFIQHLKDTQEQLYFPIDKHWNVKGNQFVAELLFEKICRQQPDFGC